ncbi:MAG: alkaline phosphatase family protein [Prevotella sp.]|nr:alkaline phosphatase family protein [Prevotella sp.]MBQ8706287.1 alkaline phosphatase family protein [Paludibacteraceae bacterium]MBQ9652065.1 alkaline phosphatase family protein [Prevotella sp.]
MKKILFLLLLVATTATAQPAWNERPRLVVGIVVDQMRWDYLSRYYDRFTDDGFRRLTDKGYSFNNCLINYIPTVTAIGHASVYTGSTPAFHGICGNDFRIDGKPVYCCQDDNVNTVGSDNKSGKRSPRNMLATTIGDQLRLHTDFKSKVIGVSYKDRAAIFPAGHSANAAYWLDTHNLRFITSTYYMDRLPEWVNRQNEQLASDKEVQKAGKDIGLTPLCGTVITDMAIAALENEKLGQGETTDMLCVSYSETDVIGHKYGTRGTLTDEAYLQLDRDLARLFQALDSKVGKGQYLLFLTADHGGAHNPEFMQENRLPAGRWNADNLIERMNNKVKEAFGCTDKTVLNANSGRIFLDHNAISCQHLNLQQVKDTLVAFLRGHEHLEFVVDFEKAATQSLPAIIRDRALMGYHYRRSGDLLYVPEPQWLDAGAWMSPTGTTHGEWNPYDAHIPMLFYGWHVPQGNSSEEVHITDIAPTVCQMLRIQQPNACVGEARAFK